MKMTIKGIERTDYVSKKTNNPVNGVKLHVMYKDPNVTGETVESLFLSDTSLENLGVTLPQDKYRELLGRVVDVEYNKYGRISSLAVS